MIIYRYERNGCGPFTFESETMDDDYLISLIGDNLDWNNHPCPQWQKYKGKDSSVYFFGCESIEELESWFTKKIIDILLNICGFELKVYDCPDEYCVRDQNQIGFIMDEAEDITDCVLV